MIRSCHIGGRAEIWFIFCRHELLYRRICQPSLCTSGDAIVMPAWIADDRNTGNILHAVLGTVYHICFSIFRSMEMPCYHGLICRSGGDAVIGFADVMLAVELFHICQLSGSSFLISIWVNLLVMYFQGLVSWSLHISVTHFLVTYFHVSIFASVRIFCSICLSNSLTSTSV